MTFHKSQKNVIPLNLSIDDIPIDSVDEFNYLGIILHEHLTWKNHINMVTNKIAKVSGILNRLKHIKQVVKYMQFEYLICNLVIDNSSVSLAVVYRPPPSQENLLNTTPF